LNNITYLIVEGSVNYEQKSLNYVSHSFPDRCLFRKALARLLKLTLTSSAAAYLLMMSITSGFKISSLLNSLQI